MNETIPSDTPVAGAESVRAPKSEAEVAEQIGRIATKLVERANALASRERETTPIDYWTIKNIGFDAVKEDEPTNPSMRVDMADKNFVSVNRGDHGINSIELAPSQNFATLTAKRRLGESIGGRQGDTSLKVIKDDESISGGIREYDPSKEVDDPKEILTKDESAHAAAKILGGVRSELSGARATQKARNVRVQRKLDRF